MQGNNLPSLNQFVSEVVAMNQRGYFQVGMKLIGLYFVAYSLIALLGSVSTVISFVSSNKEADKFGIH